MLLHQRELVASLIGAAAGAAAVPVVTARRFAGTRFPTVLGQVAAPSR
jgi:hypothetical protein